MNFALSEEQALLRDAVRRFVGLHAPMSVVRRGSLSEFDRALYQRFGRELSLQGTGIPEELGGAGGGLVELSIVAEELGRSLACSPHFASCVLAARALLRVGDRTLLPRIASGEAIATLAWSEGRNDDLSNVRTTARQEGGVWLLSGEKPRVLSGDVADEVLVAARANDGLGLFLLEAPSPRALPTMDPTRGLAHLELRDARARAVGTPGGDGAAIACALDESAIVLSAEMLGTAERAFELTVEYVKTREQFGRPIGSFQAIKHACADVLVSIESARSTVAWASFAAENGEDLATAASIAKAWASEAAFHATGQAIQLHGGIGFTWDHDVHLFFKRARASAAMLGDARFHRERVAHALLD